MRKARRVSNLEDHLGYWLRYVSNQVSHAFSLKVEGRGVTVAEWVILRELYGQDSVAPSALADRLGMTRGAISKLADRLQVKTLVTRTAGKADRRYQELALTAAGRTLVPELSDLADENDAEFFGSLRSADRATLERIMQEIVRQRGLRTVPIN
ncbi:DNA-binding MarR family transcriptional regulator [Bradyrhizobium sp. AZCC 1588]|uniref:MarR family winged helix-turn-helix transcriptional regulator n=1 Tax=unclassified Bradyrhizobium TaxID=2631580 RepID=UPI002FF0303C